MPASKADSVPEGSEPSASTRRKSFLTSWKLWIVALLLAIAAIGLALLSPLLLRGRAMRQLEAQALDYSYSQPAPEWARRFGSWSNGMRQLQRLKVMEADDDTLYDVGRLNEVRELWLDESEDRPITAAVLASLEQLRDLTDVRLFGQGFTDEGLARMFAARPPVEIVMLVDTGAGRETMRALSQIPTIRRLVIISDTLYDGDFRDLQALPELTYLDVDGLGDEGADWLSQSPELDDVSIHRAEITDEGIRRLCELPELLEVKLHGAPITAAALRELGKRRLFYLELIDCPLLTASDIASLPNETRWDMMSISASLLTYQSVARLEKMDLLISPYVVGVVSPPELRTALEEEWRIDEIAPYLDVGGLQSRINTIPWGDAQ